MCARCGRVLRAGAQRAKPARGARAVGGQRADEAGAQGERRGRPVCPA